MYKNHIKFLLVALLVLLSLFPRSIEVLNANPIFGIDQGRDYMAVKSIVIDHKLTLIGAELGAGQAGISNLFHGPGYFYLLTVPFILFDGNPVGGVVLMLLFGLSTIMFGVYFVTKFLGWKGGLLMGFLLAVCPYLIGQSRFIENHFGTPIFILLVFYFTYLFTKNNGKNSSIFFFLAGLFSAFIYNLEFAIAVPICVTLLVYSIFLFKKKFICHFPYLLFGFIIGFLPMIMFEFRHGFMGLDSLFNYLLHPQAYAFSASFFLHAKDIFNLIVYTFSDSFPGRLLFPANIIFFCFVGLISFVLFREKNKVIKNFFFFLIFLFPVNFLVFIFLRNIVFQHYITDLVLAYLIFSTYSLTWFYKNRYFKIAFFISLYLAILLFVGIQNAYKTSLYDFKDYGGVHKLKGKIDVIDFIYRDADKKPFGLFVFTPGVYTYPYDYLIWWYGKRKYGYVPNEEKKGIFYLLIEPDSSKPWSYNGWLETVIKAGTILETKELPSGLIIQKRYVQESKI